MTTRQQTRQAFVPGPIVAFVVALAALAIVSFIAVRYDGEGTKTTPTTSVPYLASSPGGAVLTLQEQLAHDMAVLEAQWDEVFGPMVGPSNGGAILSASEQLAHDMAVLEVQWDEVFGPMKADPVAAAIAEHDNAIAGALGSQVSFESSVGFPQKLMDQTIAAALAEHENAIAAIWGTDTGGSTASSTYVVPFDFETALKIAQGDIESSVAPYVR